MSGYNKLANKYNEIQKMRAYNKYIGVGAQTERMEKLLELINDFVEKINEAFGDKIDERLANTEGENVQSVITINEAKNKTYHKPFLWFHFLFHGFIL